MSVTILMPFKVDCQSGEDRRTWIHPWWGSDNRFRSGGGMVDESKEEQR